MLGPALESLLWSVTSSPGFSVQVLARSQGQPKTLLPLQEVESSKQTVGKASSSCQHQDPWDLALEFLWSPNQYIKVSSLALVYYCLACWLP